MILKKPCNRYKRSIAGMTLLELLIVISIISILASIAYPSYSQYVKESYRKQALTDMARVQLFLEEHQLQNSALHEISDNGVCNDFCQSDPHRYRISLNISANHYVITAIPQRDSGQDEDTCQGQGYSKLTLTDTGLTTPQACWK
ncbi:type IV pilin protein [Vibrio porteresiae]|uniref:Type IV pilin protein n=1 Tax=Vibrio porteresiae DSM 19223 TaxID=1123496 RepID=A0ABZ0QCY0_9VIBR|nr:type IV pilin protein [Vibrio porteresiae]WPC73383.1 type IV pilin protein [Vibrio porteresiae DSM 19223]